MLLSFPGRLGQLLIAPRAALRRIEAQGGGFRDMLLLVAAGTICLRFPQLAEALLGLTQPSQGTFMRVVGVFSNEAREAALVVIPATLAIVILGGRRRDPTLDLELGAACFAPFFMGRALVRIAVAATGHTAGAALALASPLSYAPAVAWAAWSLFRALQVARSRPLPATTASTSASAPVETAVAGEALAQPAPVEPMIEADVLPLLPPPPSPPSPPPPSQSPTSAAAPGPAVARTVLPRAAWTAGAAALVVLGAGLGFNIAWASRHFDALQPMEHGEPAPEIDLPRIDDVGGRLSLASLRGKVVLLDFWATWCPPCLQMIPILHDLHREWSPRGVEIVGVDSDGPQTSAAEVREFLHSHPAPYPMLMDDGRANTAYKIRALPQMVLVDREGAVRKVFIGYTSRRDLAAAFADLVGPGAANP